MGQGLNCEDLSSKPANPRLYSWTGRVRGDWGNVPKRDGQLNDEVLKDGSRILSAYVPDGGTGVSIITLRDSRSVHVALPITSVDGHGVCDQGDSRQRSSQSSQNIQADDSRRRKVWNQEIRRRRCSKTASNQPK